MKIGGYVNFSCFEGYKIDGPNVSYCTKNGYSPGPPFCRKICELPTVANGKWKTSNLTSHPVEGSNATLVCNKQYTVDGQVVTTLECNAAGRPSKPMPTCKWVRPKRKAPYSEPVQAILRVARTIGCIYICAIVGATTVIFGMFRIFHLERLLQMVMEISLVGAHMLILFFSEPDELPNGTYCDAVAIMVQFLFLCHFMFMMLESIQTFGIVTNCISDGGIIQPYKFFFLGLLGPAVCTFVTAALYFPYYRADLSCWLNLDHSGVRRGTTVPVLLMSSATMVFAEAGGMHATEPYPVRDKIEHFAGVMSQKWMMLKSVLSTITWLIGTTAIFYRDATLITATVTLHIILGTAIFIFHTSSDSAVLTFVRQSWLRAKHWLGREKEVAYLKQELDEF